jgi:hypothetical protein
MEPISILFGGEPFVGIIIASIRSQNGDLGTRSGNRLCGFIEILPNCGWVGTEDLGNDEEVFHLGYAGGCKGRWRRKIKQHRDMGSEYQDKS